MSTTINRVEEVDRIIKSWDHQRTEVFVFLMITARKGGLIGEHAKLAMVDMGVSFDDWNEWDKQKKIEEGFL